MGDQQPTVSVMMPCYNNADFIAAAVQSVLSQTIAVPLELLIVDDASTDHSVQVVKSISDSRIRLVQNRRNQGISRVRNQLLDQARGSYLTSLDGDDLYLDPEKLAREWKVLQESTNRQSSIAYSDVRWIDRDGQSMLLASSIAPPMSGRLYQAILDRRVMIPRDFLLSAELARSVGGFDCDLPIYEDWDYKLRLAQKARFYFTGAVGIGYRRHGAGLSAAAAPLHKHCQSIIRRKHGVQGAGGDPMESLALAGRLQGILTRNRLQQRRAA